MRNINMDLCSRPFPLMAPNPSLHSSLAFLILSTDADADDWTAGILHESQWSEIVEGSLHINITRE